MLRKLAVLAAAAVLSASAAWAEKVYVKTLQGKVIEVDIGLGDTVEALKQAVVDKEGVPADQQRLIFGGKQLEDGAKLSDYNITDGATVMLVLRIRG